MPTSEHENQRIKHRVCGLAYIPASWKGVKERGALHKTADPLGSDPPGSQTYVGAAEQVLGRQIVPAYKHTF